MPDTVVINIIKLGDILLKYIIVTPLTPRGIVGALSSPTFRQIYI